VPPKPRDLDGNYRFGGNNRFGGYAPDTGDPRDRPLIPAPDGSLGEGGPKIFRAFTAEEAEKQINRLPKDPPPKGDGAGVEDWKVPVVDQLSLESCVSCAISSVVNHLEAKAEEASDIEPSRLFLYYNARKMEGTQHDPTVGTGIRTAIKALNREGVCDEPLWPYEPDRVTWRPTDEAYDKAIYRNVEYYRIYRLPDRSGEYELDLKPVRRALANQIPVICGFTMFRSGVTVGRDGIIPSELTPEDLDHRFFRPVADGGDRPLVPDGLASFGHAAVIIGYKGSTFHLVNSWGTTWGNDGHFYLDEAYLSSSSLATDFWAITALEPRPAKAAY